MQGSEMTHSMLARTLPRWTMLRACSRMIAGSLALCLGATSLDAQQLYTVRIGGQSPPIFEYTYWHHAINNGFMKKYGIDARFVGFAAGVTSTQALAGGSVDIGCDGFSGQLAVIDRGAKVRIVQMVNADNTYIVLARDTIMKPSDLRGKKWAITQQGAISQTYAAIWLNANGVKADKGDVVDWIPVGGTAARVRAVVAGHVDAALVTIGDWIRIKDEKGIRLLATLSDTVPPLPLSSCSASEKLLSERPDIVQGYVNATIDAARHARTPEGKAQYIKLYREINPLKLKDEEYDALYDYYLGPQGSQFAIDPIGGMYPEVVASNVKMLVEDKTLNAPLPLERAWDMRFVNNYLAQHGWFDVRTGKSQLYLRDLITKK
jgi:NitT/TauT family transport system substrate-binding protein